MSSLAQLDALVGKHVMEQSPAVYWEDSYTHWRFESLPEALESMRDPFFTAFTPQESRPRSSLKEVHEYPTYSSQLGSALRVVERLASAGEPLMLWGASEKWSARFTEGSEADAETAAVAICLAALRSRGIEITLEVEPAGAETPVPFAESLAKAR